MAEGNSKKLSAKINAPLFRVSKQERDLFLSEKRGQSFSCGVKLTDGQDIVLFGLIDKTQLPPQFLAIQYTSTLSDARLGFLDAMVELLQSAQFTRFDSLSLREMENYLRDNNASPAFSGAGNFFIPIFAEVKNALKSQLDLRPQESAVKSSPSLSHDYKPSMPAIFSPSATKSFRNLNQMDKFKIMHKIFAQYISPALARDAGDAEIVFVDDALVAINYLGACATCQYSLTTTMSYIQRVIQLETHDPHFQVMTDS